MRNLTIDELEIASGGIILNSPVPSANPPGTYNLGGITVYVTAPIVVGSTGGAATQHAPLQAL
jgi:hypothetical protein